MANNFYEAMRYFCAPQNEHYDSNERRGISECMNGNNEEGQRIFLDCIKQGTKYGYYLYALTFWPESMADFEKYMNCATGKAGGNAYMALGKIHMSDPWLAGEYVTKALKSGDCSYDYSDYYCRWFLNLYEDGDIKFENEEIMVPVLIKAIRQNPSARQEYEEYIQKAQVRNIWRKAGTCPKCGSVRGAFFQKKERGKRAVIGSVLGIIGGPPGMALGAGIAAATAKEVDYCECPQCGNVWKAKIDYNAIEKIVNR